MRPSNINQKCWKLSHVNFILISYLCCSIPWVLNEFREGLDLAEDLHLVDFGVLILYNVNFIFPSGVLIYLKYGLRQRKQSKEDEVEIFI